jgi:hypothetical protein
MEIIITVTVTNIGTPDSTTGTTPVEVTRVGGGSPLALNLLSSSAALLQAGDTLQFTSAVTVPP